MDEVRRREVERLIERDPGAAAYARFLRGFYDRLDKEDPSGPVDPRVGAFVRRLFGESEHSSTSEGDASEGRSREERPPAVTPVEPHESGLSVRPTVLATDTAPPTQEPVLGTNATGRSDGRRFLMLATLASEDDRVLVRVVGDQKTEQGHLYVLSEQAERRAHVVVSIPELGLNLITDEEGQTTFNLPKGTPSKGDTPTEACAEPYRDAWAGVSAVVRRPIASWRLPPDSEIVLSVGGQDGAPEDRPGNRVLCRREDGVLTVTVEDEDAPSPTVLAAEGPEVPLFLLPLGPERNRRREGTTGGVLTVRLYE